MGAAPAKIMSIFGGSRRHGRWRVPEKTTVLALFGRCVIDLRDATADADDIRINATSVFASVLILVPDGADVLPSGTAVLASAACLVPPADGSSPLPPVRVESTTVLGKLRIQVLSDEEAGLPKKRWWQRRKGGMPPKELLAPHHGVHGAVTTPVVSAAEHRHHRHDPNDLDDHRYEVVTRRDDTLDPAELDRRPFDDDELISTT